MRPLPRVHAFTDDAIIEEPEFGVRAAAIAAGGPAVALHSRAPGKSTAALAALTVRLLSLVRPPEAAVFVSGRSDLAAATGASGVQLGYQDLEPRDVRKIFQHGWIGRSVHTLKEAETAVAEGCDFLVLGNVYATSSHAGRPPLGLDVLHSSTALRVPVIAIGGITPERVAEVHQAGAYGVAAISALWRAPDSAAAAVALLQPWAAQA